jgi:hypothetical protein
MGEVFTEGAATMTRWMGLVCVSFALSGCLETEKSCSERLQEDFEGELNWAQSQLKGGELTSEMSIYYLNNTIAAIGSGSRIRMIYSDDDQDACDFYSDGPRLRRK